MSDGSAAFYALFSNHLEPSLSRFNLSADRGLLSSGTLHFLHPVQFRLGILQSQMSVYVHGDAYVRMSHQVLKCFRIHPGFRLITAVGVAAHVRSDQRHLYLVDLVIYHSTGRTYQLLLADKQDLY